MVETAKAHVEYSWDFLIENADTLGERRWREGVVTMKNEPGVYPGKVSEVLL